MNKIAKTTINLIFTGLVLAGSYWIFQNRFLIVDEVKNFNYVPGVEIQELAEKAHFTSAGRRIFYASRPEVDDKGLFAQNCPKKERTIVLGCYTGTNIYILKVDDPKLAGVMEVTAAHEMLHGAYQRLSSGERNRINSLLEKQYAQLEDKRVLELVESYRADDASQVVNEMHSIFPTEVGQLLPELEEYYKKYFTDRLKVVQTANQYEAVFNELQQKLDLLEGQISTQKAQIDQVQEKLNKERVEIEQLKSQMDGYKQAGRFNEHDALVPRYNSLVKAYNSQIPSLEAKINNYNKLVEERNKLVVSKQKLYETLSTGVESLK